LYRDGNVWNTQLYGNGINKFGADGKYLGSYTHGNDNAQGCVIDSRPDGTGDVWIAHTLWNPSSVGHLKKDGTYVGTAYLPGEFGTTGVAVDANVKIWATNTGTDSVSRIDPAKGPIGEDGVTPVGEVDLTVYLGEGAGPYDYSDMTGSTIEAGPTTGTWAVTNDGGAAGYDWSTTTISWDSSVPSTTTLTVSVSSSDDGNAYGPALSVTSESLLTNVPDGRYLKIEVKFQRPSDKDASPVLYDLRLSSVRCTFCDFDDLTVFPSSALNGKVATGTVNGEALHFGCGLTVTPYNTTARFITVLDSESPTRNTSNSAYDPDIGSPNKSCRPGGVGRGKGGEKGQLWENCEPLGNVLILPDKRYPYPNDNVKGGCMKFTFDGPVTNITLGLLDIDSTESAVITVCPTKNEKNHQSSCFFILVVSQLASLTTLIFIRC
jgi:hypothetical protein